MDSNNLPSDIKEKPKTFFILNQDSYPHRWEEYDADGNLIRIQANKVKDPHIPEEEAYLKMQDPANPNQLILVDRRLPHDQYGKMLLGRKGMPFSNELAGIVLDRIINGESLKRITNDDDMPSYSIITRWRMENEHFREAIREAYRARAEGYLDDAMDIAMQTDDPENIVGTSKLKIDQLKVQAGFDNEKYNTKASAASKDGPAAIQINITTGVSESEYALKAAQRKLSETGEVIDLSKKESE